MQTFSSIVFQMFALFKLLVKGSQDAGANNKLVDISHWCLHMFCKVWVQTECFLLIRVYWN